jgi:hypothetical protein
MSTFPQMQKILFILLTILQLVSADCVNPATNDTSTICSGILCNRGLDCIPLPKQCLTTPCPQYACVNLSIPCIVTGCSMELCAEKDSVSSCIWKPEFSCLRYAQCTRSTTTGECAWQIRGSNSSLYVQCMEEIPVPH